MTEEDVVCGELTKMLCGNGGDDDDDGDDEDGDDDDENGGDYDDDVNDDVDGVNVGTLMVMKAMAAEWEEERGEVSGVAMGGKEGGRRRSVFDVGGAVRGEERRGGES